MTGQQRPVGVIGTGLMGTACARRLREAGFDVLGYDVDAGKLKPLAALGGRSAGSVSEVARACDKVVLAVFNTDQVEETIEGPRGLLTGRPADASPVTAICVSTWSGWQPAKAAHRATRTSTSRPTSRRSSCSAAWRYASAWVTSWTGTVRR